MKSFTQIPRPLIFLPFAAATFLLIILAGKILIVYPHDGLEFAPSGGIVESVDPKSMLAGTIHPGDIVSSINGQEYSQELSYKGIQAGDEVIFQVDRNGRNLTLPISLGLAPWHEQFSRLLPLLIALMIACVGLYVFIFQADTRQSQLFFLVAQIGGMVIAAGSVSVIGPFVYDFLFGVLTWWLTPLLIHFHLYFPLPEQLTSFRRILAALYAAAAIGSLFQFFCFMYGIRAGQLFPMFYVLRRAWLVIGLAGVLFLLIRTSTGKTALETRKQSGLVTLGAMLAIIPFVCFTVLPDIFKQPVLIPYNISITFFLAIPIAYGYAILQFRLIRLDKYVSRSIASVFTVTLFSLAYLAVYYLLRNLAPGRVWENTFVHLALTLLLALIIRPMFENLRKFTDRLFYGGSYDYRSAISQVSETLSKQKEYPDTPSSIVHGIRDAMRLECVCLLMPVGGQSFSLIEMTRDSCNFTECGFAPIVIRKEIINRLAIQPHPLTVGTVQQELGELTLSREESRFICCPNAQLWLSLGRQEHESGILVLGRKTGGGRYNEQDLEILEVIARQAGLLLENDALISDLKHKAEERRNLIRKALKSAEEERKHLARELHDQVIQILMGIDLRLLTLKRGMQENERKQLSEIQTLNRDSLNRLRGLCSELRPPIMENKNLKDGVGSLIDAFRKQSQTHLDFSFAGDAETLLPDDIAACVCWVLKEALTNIQKHALAQYAEVRLQITHSQLELDVKDNGQGFQVPPLNQLTQENHFGLAGLRERTELAGGELFVSSAHGRGCHIALKILLNTSKNGSNG